MKDDYHKCSICNKDKLKIYGTYKRTSKYLGGDGKPWRAHNVCSECYPRGSKSKIFFSTCKNCSETTIGKGQPKDFCPKKCYMQWRWKTGKCDQYRVLKEKRSDSCVVCKEGFKTHLWNKKTCSAQCSDEHSRKSRLKSPRQKQCLTCKTSFETRLAAKYCSPKCRKSVYEKIPNKCDQCNVELSSRKKYCESCKSVPRSLKVHEKRNCKTCSAEFETWVKTKLYCKKNCNPSHKLSKKLRKRTKRRAKPAWCSWKEIEAYLDTRPSDNHELDHIIPLNHPDVCGLHCPENFQWLTKEDNSVKSNNFDYSQENKKWKKILG